MSANLEAVGTAPSGVSPHAMEANTYSLQLGDAAIQWREFLGTAFSLAGPTGPVPQSTAALAAFVRASKQRGLHPVAAFLDSEHSARQAGLRVDVLGAEALIHLPEFCLRGNHRKNLRQDCSRARRAETEIRELTPPHDPHTLAAMQAVSADWVRRRRGGEVKLSLGWFEPDHVRRTRAMGAYDPHGRMVAFATFGTHADRAGLDLLRFHRSASPGTMSLLVAETLLQLRGEGVKTASLGLAPLTGPEPGFLLQSIRWLMASLGLYDFQGLRLFKNKFRPQWQPRYIAYGSRRALISILLQMAASMRAASSGETYAA